MNGALQNFPGGNHSPINVMFNLKGSGQTGVEAGGEYNRFDNSYTTSNGTSIAIKFYGNFASYMNNSVIEGWPVLFQPAAGVFLPFGPLIPNIWADDYPSLYITGQNSGTGKGIEFQGSSVAGVKPLRASISNFVTLQEPFTPTAWIYGNMDIVSFEIHNVTNDSVPLPCYGQFGGEVISLTLDLCNAHTEQVTGDPINSIFIPMEPGTTDIGQNTNVLRLNPYGFLYAGPYGAANLTSNVQFGKPVAFSYNTNVPMFWPVTTTGMTAVLSGAGTIAAGSHTFCVAPVGWNGGESRPSPVCASVTTGGSDGVLVSWTTTPGMQGYDVFMDGNRNNSMMIAGTATSYIVTALHNFGTQPALAGSGLPLIDQNQVATPLLRLPNSGFKDDVAAGTLTANRTTTLPDGNSYTTVVASLTTTAATSDNVTVTGMTSSGHCSLTPTNASADTLLTGTYISAKTTNQITVTHAATSGATFDVLCTPN